MLEKRDIQNKYECHKDICEGIHELYQRKNNDYGFAVEKGVDELGWIYLTAQLFNKFQRFQNLTKPEAEQKVKNESIEDTLLDMANYAIEGVRIMRTRKALESTFPIKDENGRVVYELQEG